MKLSNVRVFFFNRIKFVKNIHFKCHQATQGLKAGARAAGRWRRGAPQTSSCTNIVFGVWPVI
jgi:hypothetical protein